MLIPLPELGLSCEKKELKDCPFCGGKPCNSVNSYETSSGRNYIARSFVECMNCESRTKEYDTEKQANQSWNTRTADNEKSVLVIDEEKLNSILIKWGITQQLGYNKKLVDYLFQNAKSFMRIEKE